MFAPGLLKLGFKLGLALLIFVLIMIFDEFLVKFLVKLDFSIGLSLEFFNLLNLFLFSSSLEKEVLLAPQQLPLHPPQLFLDLIGLSFSRLEKILELKFVDR